AGQERGGGLGHVLALGREVEAWQAAVENSAGIVDLAVAEQVNHRGVGHGALSLPGVSRERRRPLAPRRAALPRCGPVPHRRARRRRTTPHTARAEGRSRRPAWHGKRPHRRRWTGGGPRRNRAPARCFPEIPRKGFPPPGAGTAPPRRRAPRRRAWPPRRPPRRPARTPPGCRRAAWPGPPRWPPGSPTAGPPRRPP